MATWSDVVAHIKAKYGVADGDDEENRLRILFEIGPNRSQLVYICRTETTSGGAAWAEIESPIGLFANVNIEKVLEAAAGHILGGLVKEGELLAIRHTVPLENLDINELEDPLEMVAKVADTLEQRFVAGDDF